MSSLEIWGGIECSVNRVGDAWHDQLELNGHARRAEDLELIAQLGVRTLRYPILWERTSGETPSLPNWQWADQRLRRLRQLGIAPVVGFLHHGSGPKYTGLLEGNFADGLAAFAAAFAARYPWIARYTPINEPLTTARFSGLYGLWYPHHHDNRSFARALINQCRATALSMAVIRGVNPKAELVQTEDLGTTFSTAHMEYQQRFDNERRWLTWDILCGRVDGHHPLRRFLEQSGIAACELDWFVVNPCPPQLLGINHYVTSDRYLDERTAIYPSRHHGSNAIERFADVDAVRVLSEDYHEWSIIQACWDRYRIPIVLTEVHLGCTREDQVRWLEGARNAALQARAAGCDVQAITAWSLFGAYNWDTLLTRTDGSYEPGAFDVRSSPPRPTAIATLLRNWSEGEPLQPHLRAPGWWQRPARAIYGRRSPRGGYPSLFAEGPKNGSPLLICGARGSLGGAFISSCERRNLACRALLRSELDIANAVAVRSVLQQIKPWAVINAAGFVRVDAAELHRERCLRENLQGPTVLSAAADERGLPFLTFSSDLVFDGNSVEPYVESSAAAPINAYGSSKLAAEFATLDHAGTLCVRTAAFFGAWRRGDFLSDALAALGAGREFIALDDVAVSPTYLPDLADASLDLLIDGLRGLVHLTNRGKMTWAEFAQCAAKALKISAATLVSRPQRVFGLAAQRPRQSALVSERVNVMPTLEDAVERYAVHAREAARDSDFVRELQRTAAFEAERGIAR